MFVLGPESVAFDGGVWPGVDSVAIDRSASREVVEFGDLGPYAAFIDVPEQRVTLTVTRRIESSELGGPVPGDEGELSFEAGLGRADSGRKRVSVTAVVTRVRHELSREGVKRVITLAVVSSDGAVDPVAVEDV